MGGRWSLGRDPHAPLRKHRVSRVVVIAITNPVAPDLAAKQS
jgi:hypothetical protein